MIEDRNITRRRALQWGGMAALLAAVPTSSAGAAAWANTPAAKAATLAAAPVPVSSGPISAGPYSVSPSSQLSQDYFRTADVVLDADDLVYPFHRADGSAAALVLQNGVLSLTAPDPTKPGGYSQTTLSVPAPTMPGSIVPPSFIVASPPTSLAVGTHIDGKTWLMLAIPTTLPGPFPPPRGYLGVSFVFGTLVPHADSPSTIDVVGEVWSNSLDTVDPVNTPPNVAPKLTYDQAGNLTFYAFTSELTYTLVPAASGRPAPGWIGSGYSGGIMQDALLMQYAGQDFIVLINNTTSTLVLAVGNSAAGLTDFTSCKLLGLDLIMTSSGLVPAVLFWMQLEGTSEIYLINLFDTLTRSPNGKRWFPTPPTPVANYAAFDSAAVVTSGGLWRLAAAAATQVNNTTRNVLSLITQHAALTSWEGSFTGNLPFDNDVDRVWSPVSRTASATTLFVRDALQQTLSVLSQSTPDSVWTRTTVKQSGGPKTQDLSHWRTQLTVRDAAGNPVPNYPLSITADELIGVWQETSNTVVGPTAPGTFVTDPFGRVVIGTAAEALHTAELTVTGSQLSPVTVRPDRDVQAFLAGSSSLSAAAGGYASGLFTPAALQSATVPGPTNTTVPLASVFAGQSVKVQTSTATAVVKMIGQCAAAGAAAKSGPGPGQATEFTFDNTGLVPVYGDNTEPGYVHQPLTRPAPGQLGSFGNWIDDIGKDIESAWHALEHAVVGIAKATFSYAKDAGQWVGQFAVNFANGLKATFDYVIKDLKSAFAAVAGVLSAIGAAIDKAIQWLRALLDDLIKDAVATAKQLSGSIEALPGVLQAHAKPLETTLHGGFTDLRNALDPQFDYMIDYLGGTPATSAATSTYSSQPVQGGDAGKSGSDILMKLADDVQGNWLLNKFLTSVVGLPTVTPSGNLTAAADQFFATFTEAALSDVSVVMDAAVSAVTRAAGSSPAKIAEYTLSEFLQLTKDLLDQGSTLLDEGIDVLIEFFLAIIEEFTQFLSSDLDSGILGVINDVIEALGIDFKVTIANVGCLVLAFPAVLLSKLLGAFQRTDLAGAELTRILTCVRVCALAVQLPITLTLDGLAASSSDATKLTSFLDVLSMLSLTVQNILVYPGATPGDLSTTPVRYQAGIIPNLKWQQDTLLWVWLARWSPVCWGLLFRASKILNVPVDPANLPVVQYAGNFLFGGALMLTQTLVAIDQVDKAPHGKAEGVELTVVAALIWLPLTVSALSSAKVNSGDFDVPVLIKMLVDTVASEAIIGLLIASQID